jgi:hypothetical protein
MATCGEESMAALEARRRHMWQELLPLASHESPEVRRAVIATLLWSRATPEQAEVLHRAEQDEDESVRDAAKRPSR